MAIETFTVELELELEEFTKNIKEARQQLNKLDALDVRGPRFDNKKTKESASAFDKVGGAIRGVLKLLLKAGGLIAAFKLFRSITGGVAGDTGLVTDFLKKFGAQAGFAASSVLGLGRNIVGANTSLGKFLGRVQGTTFFTGKLVSSIQQIGRVKGVKEFAVRFNKVFDSVEQGVLNLTPGLRKFTDNIKKGFAGATKAGKATAEAGEQAKDASGTFTQAGKTFKTAGGRARDAAGRFTKAGEGAKKTADETKKARTSTKGAGDNFKKAGEGAEDFSKGTDQATASAGRFGATLRDKAAPGIKVTGQATQKAGKIIQDQGVTATKAMAGAADNLGNAAVKVAAPAVQVLGATTQVAGKIIEGVAAPAINTVAASTEVLGKVVSGVGVPALGIFGKAIKLTGSLTRGAGSIISGAGSVFKGFGKVMISTTGITKAFGLGIALLGGAIAAPADSFQVLGKVLVEGGNALKAAFPAVKLLGTGLKVLGRTSQVVANTIGLPFKIIGAPIRTVGLAIAKFGPLLQKGVGGAFQFIGSVGKDVAAPAIKSVGDGIKILGGVAGKEGAAAVDLLGRKVTQLGTFFRNGVPLGQKFGQGIANIGDRLTKTAPKIRAFGANVTAFSNTLRTKGAAAVERFGRATEVLGSRLVSFANITKSKAAAQLKRFAPVADAAREKFTNLNTVITKKVIPGFDRAFKGAKNLFTGVSLSAEGVGVLAGRLKTKLGVAATFASEKLKATSETLKKNSARLKENSALYARAAAGVNNFTGGVKKFITSGTIMSVALLAVDFALALVGKALVSVGKKLDGFARKIAETAGKAELSFRKVGFSLEQANEETGGIIGSIDEFDSLIRNLSKSTGFTIQQISDMTAKFLLMAPTIGLTGEQLRGAIERTAILGASFNNLGRATIAVVDAFNANFVPLRNLVGTELNAARVTELAAEQSRLLEAAQLGVANSSDRARSATVIYNEVLKSTTPLLRTFNETTDVLTVANRRFAGTLANIASDAGRDAQASLAAITNIATSLLSVIDALPRPVKAFTVQVVALSGKGLILVGTLLKIIGLIILLTNVSKIMNLIIGANIGKFGTLGRILSDTATKFTALPVKITSVSSAFVALGQIALTSLNKLGDKLAAIIVSMTTFRVTASSLLVPFKSVGSAIGKLVAGLFGFIFVTKKFVDRVTPANTQLNLLGKGSVKTRLKILTLRSALTKLFFFLALGVELIKRANKRFQIMEKVVKPLIESVGGLEFIMKVFRRTFDLVATSIEIGTKTAFALLVTVATTVLIVLKGVINAVRGLVFAFKFLPFGIGKVARAMDDALVATEGFVDDGIKVGSEAIGDIVGEAVDLVFTLDDIARGSKDASKEVKKATVSFEEFKEALDIARQAIEAVFADSEEDFNEQVDRINRLAETQRNFAGASIKNERERARAIERINKAANARLLNIAVVRRDKEIELVKKRQTFELKVIDNLSKEEKITFSERVKRINEITSESNQANIEILRKHLDTVEKIGKADRDLADARVAAARDASERIANSQRTLINKLKELEIAGLNDIDAARERSRDFEEKLNIFRKAARGDDKVAADKALAEATAAADKVSGREAEILKSASIASKAAASDDVRDNQKRFSDINRAFFGRLPDVAKESANKVRAALFAGLPAKEEFAALATDLQTAATESQRKAQQKAILALKAINDRRKAEAKKEEKKTQAEQKQTAAETIAAAEKVIMQINEFREEAKKPFDIIAKFLVDKESKEKLEDLIKQLGKPFKIPVEVEVGKGKEAVSDPRKVVEALRSRGFTEESQLGRAAGEFGVPLEGFGKKKGSLEFGPNEKEVQQQANKFVRQFQVAIDRERFPLNIDPEIELVDTGGVAAEAAQNFISKLFEGADIPPEKLEKAAKSITDAFEKVQAEDPLKLEIGLDEDGKTTIVNFRNDISEDLTTAVDFALDLVSEQKIKDSKRAVGAKVIIPVEYANKIEVPTKSPHPIAEAADVLRSLLTPPDIEAGLGIKPGDVARGGPVGATGAAKIVRVEINMNGEQMEPINVSSDKDADNLVKAIKRTNRTRGNFRTPFTKNG